MSLRITQNSFTFFKHYSWFISQLRWLGQLTLKSESVFESEQISSVKSVSDGYGILNTFVVTLFVIYRKVQDRFSWNLSQKFSIGPTFQHLFRGQGQSSRSRSWVQGHSCCAENPEIVIALPWCLCTNYWYQRAIALVNGWHFLKDSVL